MRIGKWVIVDKEDWEDLLKGLEEILKDAETTLDTCGNWAVQHTPNEDTESFRMRGELENTLIRIENKANRLLAKYKKK
ncbi:MAG: hypothetical protein JHC26_11615 [Thermofilum sp.]|uniref:hypothetical protein n=1 Tax=Thermofilum sp. TaxID=1961369 RepID=UPI00258B4519|nr:hypothetical protein [Thermofilum sp.]MCI4409730.1 hypothetical protein [Thermofilum sp.]